MELDEQHWPLLLTTFEGRQSAGDVDYYLWKLEAARDRRPREAYVALALIGDFSPSLTLLRPLGDWMNANRADVQARCKGSALVIAAPALRFLLSSLHLIARPACPQVVVESRTTAALWLSERLAESGMPVPPYLRDASRLPR